MTAGVTREPAGPAQATYAGMMLLEEQNVYMFMGCNPGKCGYLHSVMS